VGKSALVRRFTNGVFVEEFSALPNIRNQKIHFVGNRRTKFEICEFSDTSEFANNRCYQKIGDIDAVLLCFSLSSPASLSTALDTWVPTLASMSPSTPLVLVGCKSDTRLVSYDQALTASHQCEAVMYVETSAKTSHRSAMSPFEVGALSCLGQFSRTSSLISTTSTRTPVKQKSRHHYRRDSSEPRLRGSKLNCVSSCSAYESPLYMSKSSSLSSSSLHSKSSTLSSTKSDSSMISISTTKTPLVGKKLERKVMREETVTIRCQRLNCHKEVEEVEIEVPAKVYQNIQGNGESEGGLLRNSKERKSLGSKLKKLILKD